MLEHIPVWLMDVDGVLNALGVLPGTTYRSTRAVAGGSTYAITYDPSITARLSALHNSNRVEIRWLTTWGDDANRSLAEAIGMPSDLMVEGASQYRQIGHQVFSWWKAPAAKAVVDHLAERKVIWTDDELDWRMVRDQVPWASEAENLFTLTPDRHRGLSHDDIDQALLFLAVEDEQAV